MDHNSLSSLYFPSSLSAFSLIRRIGGRTGVIITLR